MNQNLEIFQINQKIIFSLFQWSYGGYHVPVLTIYDNGLMIRAVKNNIDDVYARAKLKSTLISSKELSSIIKLIEDMYREEISEKTLYDLSQSITDQPAIDIVFNTTSTKFIRIKGCFITNDGKVSFNKDRNIFFKRMYSKPDKVSSKLKEGLDFFCKYNLDNLQDNVPEWFEEQLLETCLSMSYEIGRSI